MNNFSKIAVVDIETTGFLNQGGLIVEVAIAELDTDNGNTALVFESVVREKAFRITHTRHPFGWIFQHSDLTPADVFAAPLFEDVRPVMQSVLDGYPAGATAFNKDFDFPFLRSRGLVIRDLPCIMKTACPVLNLPSKKGYSTPKWPNVQEAWDFFFRHSGYHEAHRAADDALHEAMILYQLIKLDAYHFEMSQ